MCMSLTGLLSYTTDLVQHVNQLYSNENFKKN